MSVILAFVIPRMYDETRENVDECVDRQTRLEAVEPAGCRPAAPGQAREGAVAADPDVVADRQHRAVGDVDSSLLSSEAVHEYAERHEQAGHQGDEATTGRQLAKAPLGH